jgi:hypothetical protein
MTDQITRDELLDLIRVEKGPDGNWCVSDVRGDVDGNVDGDVGGHVYGKINGREWDFVETPTEKLQRLVTEGATKEELLLAIDRLEDNS